MLFVGDKGMLLADYGKHVLLPEETVRRLHAAAAVDPEVARPPRRSGSTPARPARRRRATSATAGLLTEANHLGNVAYRVGKKILWDHKGMRITNAPDAERFIKRPSYRDGWKLA